MSKITLAHGGGAAETRELIAEIFAAKLGNPVLDRAEDAGLTAIAAGKIALSTDSFVVAPIFFAGGDIGKLAIAGSCNDVAVSGAKPKFLSAGFILEEGLEIADLERVVDSFAAELSKNGAIIATADTKVVPKGAAGGALYINTTAIGEVILDALDSAALNEGDVIVASGSAGDHGAAIFAARGGIDLAGLESDCASLFPLVETLIAARLPIVCMRDATRGGLAAAANEWAIASGVEITLEEKAIAVKSAVLGACELLGFEPYALANEGMMIAAFRGESAAAEAVKIMRENPLGRDSAIIGRVTKKFACAAAGDLRSAENSGSRVAALGDLRSTIDGANALANLSARNLARVILRSPHGSSRYLEMPSGELLPRIC
ncbi:MAG: hydrogenase expression/formation protein HypE [Helicobacteraceae bacterium]|jgi:hydrogenase expression/formation protein HypE|nr:hydrogenase expression/formation protein HypE [Helicobacteraceae bacterium]